jgi:hypothetical protein
MADFCSPVIFRPMWDMHARRISSRAFLDAQLRVQSAMLWSSPSLLTAGSKLCLYTGENVRYSVTVLGHRIKTDEKQNADITKATCPELYAMQSARALTTRLPDSSLST